MELFTAENKALEEDRKKKLCMIFELILTSPRRSIIYIRLIYVRKNITKSFHDSPRQLKISSKSI